MTFNPLIQPPPTTVAEAIDEAQLCLGVAAYHSTVSQMPGAFSPFTERAIDDLMWASWRKA